jgi:hypothetical protein
VKEKKGEREKKQERDKNNKSEKDIEREKERERERERDRLKERQTDRQTDRQGERSPHLNKKLFSGQKAETSLMIDTKISVEDTLPISKKVFSHLFNDHATGIFVGTRTDRLKTGNGSKSFIVDVEDSLWKKIETFLIIASF